MEQGHEMPPLSPASVPVSIDAPGMDASRFLLIARNAEGEITQRLNLGQVLRALNHYTGPRTFELFLDVDAS